MSREPLQIQKGVPRPVNLPPVNQGGNKYNFAQMEVDDYVEVPKEWWADKEENFQMSTYSPKKHRDRVYQSARTHALNHAKAERAKPGFDEANFKQKKFTVVALESGDIGVWRDE